MTKIMLDGFIDSYGDMSFTCISAGGDSGVGSESEVTSELKTGIKRPTSKLKQDLSRISNEIKTRCWQRSKIKAIKSAARGFRNFAYYRIARVLEASNEPIRHRVRGSI